MNTYKYPSIYDLYTTGFIHGAIFATSGIFTVFIVGAKLLK